MSRIQPPHPHQHIHAASAESLGSWRGQGIYVILPWKGREGTLSEKYLVKDQESTKLRFSRVCPYCEYVSYWLTRVTSALNGSTKPQTNPHYSSV